MTAIKIWLVACRPHTLSAAIVPVLVGSALAGSRGSFDFILFLLTLLGAVLVQIGTNLTDEYSDHGATDSELKYLAPYKVIKRGLLSSLAVKTGATAAFGLATLIGAWLIWHTGWPLLLVCLVSVFVAWAYAGGPYPLGNYALGEVLVFLVMGPNMVVATEYVQTRTFELESVWLSLPVAGLVTAILVVNNLRDEAEDKAHGRKTLTVLFGTQRNRWLYIILVAMAYLVPLISVLAQSRSWLLLVPWFTFPLAFLLCRTVYRAGDRDVFHFALRATAILHMLFGAALAIAIFGDHVLSGYF